MVSSHVLLLLLQCSFPPFYWVIPTVPVYLLYKASLLTPCFSPATAPFFKSAAAAAAKSLQSCPTLCDPIDGSPPGSPIPGILQARTLEWVAISFSNAWEWKVKVKALSRVRLFVTPWTAAYQAPPSMGFSRQEYWSGVPLPSPNLLCSKTPLNVAITSCLQFHSNSFLNPLHSSSALTRLSHPMFPVPFTQSTQWSALRHHFFFWLICIYLAAPGLSCNMWDL